jgi:hypothetical protein
MKKQKMIDIKFLFVTIINFEDGSTPLWDYSIFTRSMSIDELNELRKEKKFEAHPGYPSFGPVFHYTVTYTQGSNFKILNMESDA